jgi:Peptidase propeptide and YPEB domain
MDTHQESPRRPNRLARLAAAAAISVGLGVGSYGIASAATGSGTTSTPTATNAAPAAPPGASSQAPWGQQRSDETLLTGDTLAKVKAIAEAKVPGGTIIRVETDADGVAAYEAHMTKADGSPVTVYVDKDFNFVSVQ